MTGPQVAFSDVVAQRPTVVEVSGLEPPTSTLRT